MIFSLNEVVYLPVEKKLNLIFEYLDYDLKKYMSENKSKVTPYELKLFLYQLINGVNYCHSRRIIHRDLKPQNLLVDRSGNLKIADFGLARAFGIPIKTLTHEIETLWYRAPEVLLGQKQYSLGVDIWAVGCIFAELIEKRPLFNGDSEIDQIFKIFQFHGTPTQNEWANIHKLPDFKPTFPKFKGVNPETHFKNFDRVGLDLAMRLLALDPARRISMKEALKHPYFNDISVEDINRFQV